ncbi:MAG: aminotransferase class IV [Actinobacteria bacterium]|nr:aminotransferase class IV [Actinomycetota bacterium]
MSNYVFVNGRLVSEKRACISVKDRGFLYGDGLFETIRSYKGYVFSLNSHVDRLFTSLRILGYRINFDKQYLCNSLYKTLKANRLERNDAYIKIIVTRGRYEGKLSFNSSSVANIVIITSLLKPYPSEYYRKGIKVISSSIRRDSLRNQLYTHKLLNYFENVFARNEAYTQGAVEALFLTRDYLVLEGATSNIFLVKNGTVYTPPLTQNILPGITRDVVIDICKENNIKVKERKLHYFDIVESSEVFLTNSIMEVMPVSEVDTHKIGAGVPGDCTRMLMELYGKRVNKDKDKEKENKENIFLVEQV